MPIATAPAPTEERIRAYGQEIFARLDRRAPVVFSPAWLDDRLMEWSMGDPAIKVQLFRFIDALPNLKSTEEISHDIERDKYLTAEQALEYGIIDEVLTSLKAVPV